MSIEKRIERIEAILDARGLDWDHPRVEDDHFAGANKMVAEKPAKEPPKKWRILEPGEVVCSDDRVKAKTNPPSDPPNGLGWCPVDASVGTSVFQDDPCIFARLVSDEPAKQPEAAWEPKVGDWVKVTRPENWRECKDPEWVPALHQHNGMVMQISRFEQRYGAWVANFDGIDWFFHRDWLSPAEPPKPPQPEYREPVLPADEGKWCEFSEDGRLWVERKLLGYRCHVWLSVSMELGSKAWVHARIKKDA